VNSAAKLTGQEKPSSDHILLGLARRSTLKKAGTTERHLGGVTARSIISKLVDTAESNAPRGAARAIQAAMTPGVPKPKSAPAGRVLRARPTTKPSAKKATPLATKAPVKEVRPPGGPSPDRAAPAKRATKASAKKAAAKRAPAKKLPLKKSPTKKAPAKKLAAKKAPAKKLAAKNAPAKRSSQRTDRRAGARAGAEGS
jgi:hypothetical protein